MLTLERKEGESIIVYNNEIKIEISLKEARGGKAKININAPKELKIFRK